MTPHGSGNTPGEVAKHLEAQVAKHLIAQLGITPAAWLCSSYRRGIFEKQLLSTCRVCVALRRGLDILDPCVLTVQKPGNDIIDAGLASTACPVLPAALTAA